MAKGKLSLAEEFQSAQEDARWEMLQEMVDAYLRGAITAGSAFAHP